MKPRPEDQPDPRRWPRWMRYPVAAEYSGLSVPTLERLVASGELPARRWGARVVVIDVEQLDRWWLAQGSVSSATPLEGRR